MIVYVAYTIIETSVLKSYYIWCRIQVLNINQSVLQKKKILLLINSNQWRNKAKGSFEYI